MDDLRKKIGSIYKKLDNKGNYFGCFEPLYTCFPKLPKYKLPKDSSKQFEFSIQKLEQVGKKVEQKDLIEGDVIAFRLPKDIFHLGIYAGNGKMFQTFAQNALQISRVNFDNHRIVGFYRIDSKFYE